MTERTNKKIDISHRLLHFNCLNIIKSLRLKIQSVHILLSVGYIVQYDKIRKFSQTYPRPFARLIIIIMNVLINHI